MSCQCGQCPPENDTGKVWQNIGCFSTNPILGFDDKAEVKSLLILKCAGVPIMLVFVFNFL